MSTSPNVDLAALSHTPIHEYIAQDVLKQALQQPPFVPLAGAVNLRDLGAAVPSGVRRGLIFRSATLTLFAQESLDYLYTDLHIRREFDLRSQRETEADPSPSYQWDRVGMVISRQGTRLCGDGGICRRRWCQGLLGHVS